MLKMAESNIVKVLELYKNGTITGEEAEAMLCQPGVVSGEAPKAAWDDDGKLRIVAYIGRYLLKKGETGSQNMQIELGGDRIMNVECWGNLTCEDVGGNISADGSISCEEVGGNASAGGSLTCEDVAGDAKAGGNLTCEHVDGNAGAGGSIRCESIGGHASALGSVFTEQ